MLSADSKILGILCAVFFILHPYYALADTECPPLKNNEKLSKVDLIDGDFESKAFLEPQSGRWHHLDLPKSRVSPYLSLMCQYNNNADVIVIKLPARVNECLFVREAYRVRCR